MPITLLTTLLLLATAPLALAQPPHALLALIEQHNPELVQQRRLLDATAAGPAGADDDAGVLELLRQQEQSWLRHFRVSARTGLRVSPGEEGSGLDTRAALEFSLPLGDQSGDLAIAKERLRQQKARQTQTKAEARQRLAYERQRAALRAQVLAALAELQAAAIERAATQQMLERRLERQPRMQRRVEQGVDTVDKLWALDDEINELEKRAALLSSQLEQQRMAVAMLAGEAWERALGLLERQPVSQQ